MTPAESASSAYPGAVRRLLAGLLIHRITLVVAPFLALYLRTLGWSERWALWGGALYALGAFAAMVPAGLLADRRGRRTTILGSMGGTVLAMGGLALVHDPVLLVVLVFLAGFFAESYRPAVTAMLTDLVSPTHRGATYALQMSVLNLGAAISPVLGGLVAGSNHYSWLFWIHCAGALALGVVTWRWLPETVPPRPAESTSFRALLKDPPLRFFYGGVLLVASGFFQLLTALPVYLKEHLAFGAEGSAGAVPGQGSPWWLRPELQCGLLLFLKGALIVLIAVRLTRKLRGLPHKELLALGSLLSGLGLALIGCSPQLRWAVGGVVLLTLGEILVHPSALAYLAARVPAELRARAMGLFALTQGCAFFLAPVWAGVLLPWLGPAWFWCIAAITTAAAAACFRAVPTESPAQLVE